MSHNEGNPLFADIVKVVLVYTLLQIHLTLMYLNNMKLHVFIEYVNQLLFSPAVAVVVKSCIMLVL